MENPTETNNKLNLSVVYQDLSRLQNVTTDLGSQIQRIQRIMKIDEKEEVTQQRRSERMLLQAVENNTEVSLRMLAYLEQKEFDPLDMSPYYARKKREELEREKRLRGIKELTQLRQKVTKVCPCGEHKGIAFLDKDNKVVEERCPRSWWISLYRLAYEEGRLDAFVTTTPIDIYLKRYSLK